MRDGSLYLGEEIDFAFDAEMCVLVAKKKPSDPWSSMKGRVGCLERT